MLQRASELDGYFGAAITEMINGITVQSVHHVFDNGAELLVSVFWTLSIVTVFFPKPLHFKGWLFPRPLVKSTLLDPLD
jgi:hypothetical protein